jgi:hypothetical protein
MSIDILNITGAAIAALTSVVAVLIKTWAMRSDRMLDRGVKYFDRAETADPLQPAFERLKEVQAALARQQSVARTNRWMSRLLTVGQYIIGGLLASSFVQQSLSREMVGALGLLVLISSLIYQHFRPDIQLRGAMGRSLRLRALMRQADDDLYAMRASSPGAPSVADFRRKISATLSDIEESEFQDVTARSGEDSHPSSK